MLKKFTKRIVSFMAAAVMAVTNTMPIAPISVLSDDVLTTDVETQDSELTMQTLEVSPDEENSEKIITLEGLMPEGAEAQAVDLSEERDCVAAYDITITNGDEEFQPDEESPIKVEITDPVITDSEGLQLWHIKDDGEREQIFGFTLEDGKITFYAEGFSVYEIVDSGFDFTETYDKVPVSGDTSFSVFEVNQVAEQENYVYNVVQKTYPDVRGTVTQVSDLSDLTTHISNGDGFYISSVKTGFFAKNYQENDLKLYKGAGRTGIAITDSYNTTDSLSNMFNAYNSGAKKFYFEKTAQNENYYYIYTYENESDPTSIKYVGHVSGKNRLYLTNDSNNTDQTAKTKWTVGYDIANNCFYFKDTNVSWYWNETYEAGKPNYGFSAYSDDSEKDKGARFQLWLYTPADLSTDPYELDGNTYGLVNYQSTTTGNALLAGNYNNTGTQLGNNQYLTPDSETPSKYTSSYGITGWQFEWIPNTVTYKISAIADEGAIRKYLKLDSTGLSLVGVADATAFAVEPNNDNKIKLRIGNNAINRNSNTSFNRANDGTGTALYFDLVDVSSYTTDALGLGGKTYGLINYQNATTGNAMMASAYSAVKLNNQKVTPVTNSNGDIEYTYLGEISKWTFTYVDSNRYFISTVTDEGTRYLKLIKDSLSLSETPFILSVIAGTGDYTGKIKISNATDKQDIYRNSNTSFDYTGTGSNNNASKWFDLVTVPDAPTADPLGLDGNTYGIVGTNSNKYYAMQAEQNTSNVNQLLGTQLTLNDGKYELSNNVVSGWTFHWVDRTNYKITDGFGRYIKLNGTTSISLVNDEDEASVLSANIGTGDNAGKIQLLDLSLNRYINCNGNFTNNSATNYFDLVSLANQVDPLKLNGKTYGLVYYTGGTSGNALIADSDTHFTKLYEVSSRKKDDPTDTKNLFVPSLSDITMWTFENVSEDYYRLKTDSNKYLRSDGSELSIVTDENEATSFKVTPTTSGGHIAITMAANGTSITFDTDRFTVSNTATPLCFVQKAELSEDDQITYTANRISVSDGKRAYNGAQLIVYTRIWDETNKKYDFYAIDHDGSLKQCYAYGDKLMWMGDVMNTLLWDFTVYYDKGQENGYYELQNVYSGKYLAPQLPKNGQILQDNTIGIQLPGRKYELENGVYTYGEYYSHIIAWDDSHYDYAALRAEAAQKETAEGNTVFSDVYAKADTFYFATLDSIDSATSGLHEVTTIDNDDYGITMKMIDFGDNTKSTAIGSDVTNTYFKGTDTNKSLKNILCTNLDENGNATVNENVIPNSTDTNFGNAFANAATVNKLFIKSIHDSSGYFEFDSCQNYATLLNENGEVSDTFRVYRELGTHDSSTKNTLRHGQFFPYNDITAGVYDTGTNAGINLYSFNATMDNNINIKTGQLSDDDPRKYEPLHKIVNPNYYFGMELEAKFVQTPSGLDAWGHDVIFEFTGDDDFWLFVDGELVIDLGGNHSALDGKVNFRTGEVSYNGDDSNHRTLKDIFYNNYLGRKHTHAEAEDFVLKQYCSDGNGGVRTLTLDEFKNAVLYLDEYNDYKDSHTASALTAYLTALCNGRTITLDEYIKLHKTEFDAYEAAKGESAAIAYYKTLCTEDITPEQFQTLYPDVCANYTEAHDVAISDAHFTELLEDRTITLDEYKLLHSDEVTAIEAAITAKEAEPHTAEEAQAYVDSIFETNDDGQYVFKDYTEHSMKVYYMERGAGASNLHMRFNLSAVTPGNVMFAKTMSGAENSDVDFSAIQFPFQIQYKYTEDEAVWRNLTNAKDSQDKPSVSYQNSTLSVRYADSYQSPNANKIYNNVFFLIPGRAIEINFPDNAMYYQIVECAVDKDIYDVSSSSGGGLIDNSLAEESGVVISSGNIHDLITHAAQVSEQPTITFDNKINSDNIRSLNITKHLYDGSNKTTASRINNSDDTPTFNFRVYLSNGTGDELALADLCKYYVLDTSYNLCTWNASDEKFEPLIPNKTVNDIPSMTEDEKQSITFHTSRYGAISNIPIDYTVRIPGLIAGTKFLVEERDYEIPVGYELMDFECKTGQFTEENNSTGVASYKVDNIYTIDGQVYYINGEIAAPSPEAIAKPAKYKNSAGTIIAGYQAEVIVNNYKGYGIKAEKQWTDEDFTESHGDIYAALYVDGKTDPIQVKCIKSPDITVQFFFENLETGRTLDDYKVYEVDLANAVVNNNGIVTGYSNLVKKDDSDKITISVTDTGKTSIDEEYTVSYPNATDAESQKLFA